MADDLSLDLGDERPAAGVCAGPPQGIEELRFRIAREGRQLDGPDRDRISGVARALVADRDDGRNRLLGIDHGAHRAPGSGLGRTGRTAPERGRHGRSRRCRSR